VLLVYTLRTESVSIARLAIIVRVEIRKSVPLVNILTFNLRLKAATLAQLVLSLMEDKLRKPAVRAKSELLRIRQASQNACNASLEPFKGHLDNLVAKTATKATTAPVEQTNRNVPKECTRANKDRKNAWLVQLALIKITQVNHPAGAALRALIRRRPEL
jgi:hypothetical protein